MADVQKRRYKNAERTLATLLEQKKLSVNGLRLLEEVYADPLFCTQPNQIEEWYKARKKSHFPKVILGSCLAKEAWRIRGNGPVKSVSIQQRTTINKLLHRAQLALESAWAMQPQDPQSASLLISVSLLQDQTIDVIDAWFRKAIEADKCWMAAYRAKFYTILPMWRGSNRELMNFLRTCVNESPKGSIVYTLPLELLKMKILRPTRLDIMVAIFPEGGEKARLIDKAINQYRYDFPHSPWPDFYQGVKNRYLFNNEESISDFAKALLRDVDNQWALAARSEVLYNLGHIDEAEADLLHLIRIAPEDARTYAQLGALRILQHNDVDKGIALYKQAFRLEKRDTVQAVYSFDLGDILAQKSHYEKAIVYFTNALEADPTFSRARLRRADIYELTGKPQEALEDILALAKLDPKFAEMAKQRAEQLIRSQAQTNPQPPQPPSQAIETTPDLEPSLPPYPIQATENSLPPIPLSAPANDPPQDLDDCENLYFRRMPQEAKTCVMEVLQTTPRHAAALALQGKIASDLEADQHLAAKFFGAAVKQEPQNERYIFEFGRALYLDHQWEQAITVYSKLLEVNGTLGEAHYQRGLCFEAVGRNEEAIKDMQLAKMYGFASPELDSFLQRHTPPPPVPLVNEQEEQRWTAEEDLRMGRFDQAEHAFLLMLQQNPQDDYALFQLGQIYSQWKRNSEKALEYYGRAIAANPKRPEIYLYRAALYSSQEKFELAAEDYSSMLEISPNKDTILADRAHCYMQLGEYTKAETDLRKALENAQSGKDEYTRLLAVVSAKTGSTIGHKQETAPFYVARGIQLASQNKPQQAKDDFLTAISLEQNNFSAHYELGCLYKEKFNDRKNALTHLNKAIELHSSDASFFLDRGLVYYELKEYLKAKSDFTSGLQIDNNSAQLYYYRGDCNKELGLKNEAKYDLLRAKSIDPSWGDAVTGLLKEMKS
ncbi:tetratricopeptide repeat protein [Desulfobulbus rhabdoformis]|uniref:tetratricopeptide repeat protein n=1 Tax=Desulfobulbus rhabdoformis TaxID=34032 RepID=UPI0019668056|nr:tetratricopeptide repeat protein [Desulfobulbus rhabdoformis]MBM9614088.1 tetratricopeptide repeat protein [Desulfobulbus rhabdoformis]